MPQITDLNVAPYYDDFDKDDNFHRVLFRPGFAVQARELTQLQSIMQNQIERFGRHMFQEGTVVIPGQVTYANLVTNIQLSSTFAGETIVPSQYYNATNPVIITGATSGMQAQVIGFVDGTATQQPALLVRYINSGMIMQLNRLQIVKTYQQTYQSHTTQRMGLQLHLQRHILQMQLKSVHQ